MLQAGSSWVLGTLEGYVENRGWPLFVASFALTPALMFISGGLFGDFSQMLKSPQKARELGSTARVVEKAARDRAERYQRIIRFLEIINPMVTAFLAVVTAILSLVTPIIVYFITGKSA